MKFKELSVVTTTLTVTGILFFDKASKAQFSGSCTIPNFEVYQHDDGGGASFRGCSNEYNSLRDDPNIINDFNWNDEISSIRTSSNPVSLYSDSQFQGSCIVVSTGSIRSSSALNLRPLGFNDVVSSIRVGRDSRCTDLTASSSTNTPPNVPVFDPNFYLMSYSDLRSAFRNDQEAARNHWLRNGIREGRRGSPAFDVQYYLATYPDLQRAFGSNYASAIDHWLNNGIREGRKSSLVFDVQYYLGRYPDLQNAFGRNNYAAAVNHWLSNGIREGRRGSADFDPRFYLSNNPDVARAFGANNYQGAITHYLTNGRREGRRGTP